MHKFNYFCSVILTIALPLALLLLSSNLVLRVPATYGYHFNDSQVVDEVPYRVSGSEFASDIAGYWSSLDGEAFQSYEVNGSFRDPVFDQREQQVMQRAKLILNVALLAGLLCLIVTVAIYAYLWRGGYVDALRNRMRLSMVLSLLVLIAHGVLWCIKKFRRWCYAHWIGIALPADSTLRILLGDPSFKTYVIFASVLGGALLALTCYINHQLTKPSRMFY